MHPYRCTQYDSLPLAQRTRATCTKEVHPVCSEVLRFWELKTSPKNRFGPKMHVLRTGQTIWPSLGTKRESCEEHVERCSRRFLVKEPRHSENVILYEKRYLYGTTRPRWCSTTRFCARVLKREQTSIIICLAVNYLTNRPLLT